MLLRYRYLPEFLIPFASLCSFAGVGDVNYSTGQLEFSKTVMTVESHRLSFPINLNYSSRVTKHQRASWVGFGFDLDMPYIEREVKGYPDERSGHSRYSWDYIEALSQLYAPYSATRSYNPSLLFDYYVYNAFGGDGWLTPSTTPCTNPLGVYGTPCLDLSTFDVNCQHLDNQTQQDVYTINALPAGGGRIFFGMDGKVNVTPYRPWIVSYAFSGSGGDRDIASWTITDGDGVTYTFDSYLKSTTYGGYTLMAGLFDNAKITFQSRTPDPADPSQSQQLCTALEKNEYTSPYIKRWYLTSMVGYDGDRIDFTYNVSNNIHMEDNSYFTDINKFSYNGKTIAQGILVDKSETIATTVTPATIQTDLHIATFSTGSDGPVYGLGRDRLTGVTLKDKVSNASLETVTFSQTNGANGLYEGRLRLNDVYLTKHGQSDTRKRLYHFGYTTAMDLGDYFGSVDGVVDHIENINGGITTYGYSNASFGQLSDGTITGDVPFGQVVSLVSQAGGSNTPSVNTYIEYQAGEANYGSVFSGNGIDESLALLQYGEIGSPCTSHDLCLDYEVHYGRVTTSMTGKGRTVYAYYLSNDFFVLKGVANAHYPLKDDPNEYNLNASYRYRLHQVDQYAEGATTPLSTTTYKYVAQDFSQSGGGSGYHYEKPQTYGQHYLFVLDQGMWCVASMLNHPDFDQTKQFGLPAAEIARVIAVYLTQEDVKYLGVTKTTEYYYNGPGGLVSDKIEHHDANTRRVTSQSYACEKYPAYFTPAKNLLSPVAVTQTQYWDLGPTPAIIATVKARVDCWSSFNGIYYPSKSYAWCEQHKDASGLPTPVFDLGEFNFSTNTGSSRWLVGEAVVTRNAKGYVQDVYFGPDHLWNTTVYRNDKYYPIAQVAKARNDWTGVFTCDYDVTPASVDDIYFDQVNGWKQGGALLVVPPADKKHFGEKVVQVTNRNGPTKDITVVDPNRDYILSAWVCPLNTNPVRLVVEPHPHGTSTTNFDDAATGLVQNQWQPVTKKITGAELRSRGITGSTGDYLTVWVGCKVGENTNLYVDDIRFYPADALVTTSYYDWRGNVICTVDANDKPKFFTYDGWDRVSSIKNSKGQLVQSFDYHLQGDVP